MEWLETLCSISVSKSLHCMSKDIPLQKMSLQRRNPSSQQTWERCVVLSEMPYKTNQLLKNKEQMRLQAASKTKPAKNI